MRILVATTYTIPAFSGGWTTPLDLFGKDHQAMYVINNYPAGTKEIEGVKVVGSEIIGFLSRPWPHLERYRNWIQKQFFRMALKKSFEAFNADFALCLDPEAGYSALELGIPYAMRFHSLVTKEAQGPCFDKLMSKSLFNISGPTTYVSGTIPVAHNQDLSRFTYAEALKPERAILLTSIDKVHEPEVFIEGVMLSKNTKGDIVGTGPDRERIAKLCRKTNNRVRCLPPVARLKVPQLLSRYQIGVATVKPIAPVLYQMKVNAYMASGLYTLAKPWTHISIEAPNLVGIFENSGDLADRLDDLEMNWESTLPVRREAREWVHKHYSVEISRRQFKEVLARTFNSSI